MVKYAIVEASGKQFWVEERRFYDFDKLPLNEGEEFTLSNILLVALKDQVVVGTPFLNNEYIINATVLRHISGPKVKVYKMRPKKKTRKMIGYRSCFTRIFINSISRRVATNSLCIV